MEISGGEMMRFGDDEEEGEEEEEQTEAELEAGKEIEEKEQEAPKTSKEEMLRFIDDLKNEKLDQYNFEATFSEVESARKVIDSQLMRDSKELEELAENIRNIERAFKKRATHPDKPYDTWLASQKRALSKLEDVKELLTVRSQMFRIISIKGNAVIGTTKGMALSKELLDRQTDWIKSQTEDIWKRAQTQAQQFQDLGNKQLVMLDEYYKRQQEAFTADRTRQLDIFKQGQERLVGSIALPIVTILDRLATKLDISQAELASIKRNTIVSAGSYQPAMPELRPEPKIEPKSELKLELPKIEALKPVEEKSKDIEVEETEIEEVFEGKEAPKSISVPKNAELTEKENQLIEILEKGKDKTIRAISKRLGLASPKTILAMAATLQSKGVRVELPDS